MGFMIQEFHWEDVSDRRILIVAIIDQGREFFKEKTRDERILNKESDPP